VWAEDCGVKALNPAWVTNVPAQTRLQLAAALAAVDLATGLILSVVVLGAAAEAGVLVLRFNSRKNSCMAAFLVHPFHHLCHTPCAIMWSASTANVATPAIPRGRKPNRVVSGLPSHILSPATEFVRAV
jgi:hypothetical protein